MPNYDPVDISMEDDDDLTPGQRMARIISPDSTDSDITGAAKGTPNYQPPAQNTAGIPATVSATASTPAWHPPMSGGPNPNSSTTTPAWHAPMAVPGSFSSILDPETADAKPAAAAGVTAQPATTGVDPNSFAAKQLAGVGPAPQVDTTKLADLQAQRAKLAVPTAINDPNHPEYRPGIGTKIRRGIGAYFAGGPAGVLETNYNAPTRKYGLAEQLRQANLGQANAQISDFDTLNKEQQANYAGKLNQAKDVITLQKNDELAQSRSDNLDVKQQLADTRQQLADYQTQGKLPTTYEGTVAAAALEKDPERKAQLQIAAKQMEQMEVKKFNYKQGADPNAQKPMTQATRVKILADKNKAFSAAEKDFRNGVTDPNQYAENMQSAQDTFEATIESVTGNKPERFDIRDHLDANGNWKPNEATVGQPAAAATTNPATANQPAKAPQGKTPTKYTVGQNVLVDGKPAVVTGINPKTGKPIVRAQEGTGASRPGSSP